MQLNSYVKRLLEVISAKRWQRDKDDSKHRSYFSIYIYWNCCKIMEKLSVVHINYLYLQALHSNIWKRSLTVCHHMTQNPSVSTSILHPFPGFCSTSQGRVKNKSRGLWGTHNRKTGKHKMMLIFPTVIFAASCNNSHVNIKKTRLLFAEFTCDSVCLTVKACTTFRKKVHLHTYGM